MNLMKDAAVLEECYLLLLAAVYRRAIWDAAKGDAAAKDFLRSEAPWLRDSQNGLRRVMRYKSASRRPSERVLA